MRIPNEMEQDYEQRIVGHLRAIEEEISAGNITSEEARDEFLHESIDGSDILYTREAIQVLLCCRNEDAYVDQFGDDAPIRDGRIAWPLLAYCALMEDVRDRLPEWEDQ
ncbi:hypothetical protein [uncultured Mediterranean phage uvDeep-CGR2-KM24-C26]|nr:hypothetical protein [uncultured Mediterranean phage uvDeep-CGR2-KM24-C26]